MIRRHIVEFGLTTLFLRGGPNCSFNVVGRKLLNHRGDSYADPGSFGKRSWDADFQHLIELADYRPVNHRDCNPDDGLRCDDDSNQDRSAVGLPSLCQPDYAQPVNPFCLGRD